MSIRLVYPLEQDLLHQYLDNRHIIALRPIPLPLGKRPPRQDRLLPLLLQALVARQELARIAFSPPAYRLGTLTQGVDGPRYPTLSEIPPYSIRSYRQTTIGR